MDFLLRMTELFHKGGPVMYVLVLCSLLVVAIAVERFYYFRAATSGTKPYLEKVQPLLEKRLFAEAMQLSEQTPALAGRIASGGLKTYERGGNVENALESASALAAARSRSYFNYLSAVVTLAPLLGLLGTVIGMIESFSVLHVKAGQPMAITGGVGEALVATASGLSVAILALVIHTYFAHRLDNLVTDLEQLSGMILDALPRPDRRDHHETA